MDYQKKFRVKPGEKLRLKKLDPSFTGEHESEAIAKEATEHSRAKLAHEQNLLYAEHKHSVLIVLQAMDAGGKDGTIKHVFSGVNPQGVHVASFKQPTEPELAHDSRRVHPHTPGRGQISIFNRSHYEDVLVDAGPQAHRQSDLDPALPADLRLRGPAGRERNDDPQILPPYQQGRAARAFRPAPRGSRPQLEDQRGRLYRACALGRLFEAFEDAIRATSTHEAPWYVIPSNANRLRNLAVSRSIAYSMADLDLAYPPPSVHRLAENPAEVSCRGP